MAKSLMQQAAEQIARQNGVVPITGTFDESKGVAGRVAAITSDTSSPLMKLAATQGSQLAAQRGLTNSTLAAQAAQNAVIGAATPIANADAGLYQQQQLTNQQAGNAAATTNAQIGSNAGLAGLNLDNSNEQQDKSLAAQAQQFTASQAQQAQQFGVTSGMTQQQIDAQKAQAAANLAQQQAQFGVSSGLQQQQVDIARGEAASQAGARATQLQQAQAQIDAQRDQFAAQLGITREDMELKRGTLTQNQQQFLANLDQQKAQLAQNQQQFAATQAQQITLANLDAATRKDLIAVEAQYKKEINSDTNIAGAWGTMTQAIQAIQNNPNLDGPAKTTSINNQLSAFRAYTAYWGKASPIAGDMSDLLNFGIAAEQGSVNAAPSAPAAPVVYGGGQATPPGTHWDPTYGEVTNG